MAESKVKNQIISLFMALHDLHRKSLEHSLPLKPGDDQLQYFKPTYISYDELLPIEVHIEFDLINGELDLFVDEEEMLRYHTRADGSLLCVQE